MADKPNTIMQQLQAPFPADGYEWRVGRETHNGKRVTVLCYVTSRHIQNRLDEIFGPFGWYPSYSQGPDGGVMCKLCCQDPDNPEVWIGKQDGAANTAVEAVKGGISAALKRAGSVWGIGRLLYNLDATSVELKASGQHFHKVKADGANKDKWLYWDEPKLPDWAVAGENKPKADNKRAKPQPEQELSADKALGTKAINQFDTAVRIKLRAAKTTLLDKNRNAVLELLCGSKTVATICGDTGKPMPLLPEFKLVPDHSSWEVLAKAIDTMTIPQFRKLLAAAAA